MFGDKLFQLTLSQFSQLYDLYLDEVIPPQV